MSMNESQEFLRKLDRKLWAAADIRRALVEADLVECMVAPPGQLFTNTGLPL